MSEDREYRHLINIDKFLKNAERWINREFSFSDCEKKETLEELTDMIIKCTQPNQQVWNENDPLQQIRAQVLEELWKFCLINGAEEHGDLIGLPKDPFFPLKLLKKIAELKGDVRK